MFFYKLKVESKIYLFIFNLKKSMKKIIMSLAMIAAVGAIVVGATRAYFSDTETSTGNTFTAGTIDIAIDGKNPWQEKYSTGDLKPCETGYMNFKIQNVGMNPVNVSKKLYKFVNNGGIMSEPECEAEKGVYANSNCSNNTAVDDVQSQIIYDLYVEVFASENETNPIWWQAIYEDADNMSLTAVYGENGGNSVELGMIPVGGYMKVSQSYHFACKAGNQYQGDTLTFDMEIMGEQLTGEQGYASVVLENKEKGADGIWDIVQTDNIVATLQYKTKGPKFDYILDGISVLPNTNYVLLVGENPWENPGTACDSSIITSEASGEVNFSEQLDCASMNDAKAWLVLADDWNGTNMTGWHEADYLFETALVDYTKN